MKMIADRERNLKHFENYYKAPISEIYDKYEKIMLSKAPCLYDMILCQIMALAIDYNIDIMYILKHPLNFAKHFNSTKYFEDIYADIINGYSNIIKDNTQNYYDFLVELSKLTSNSSSGQNIGMSELLILVCFDVKKSTVGGDLMYEVKINDKQIVYKTIEIKGLNGSLNTKGMNEFDIFIDAFNEIYNTIKITIEPNPGCENKIAILNISENKYPLNGIINYKASMTALFNTCKNTEDIFHIVESIMLALHKQHTYRRVDEYILSENIKNEINTFAWLISNEIIKYDNNITEKLIEQVIFILYTFVWIKNDKSNYYLMTDAKRKGGTSKAMLIKDDNPENLFINLWDNKDHFKINQPPAINPGRSQSKSILISIN